MFSVVLKKANKVNKSKEKLNMYNNLLKFSICKLSIKMNDYSLGLKNLLKL